MARQVYPFSATCNVSYEENEVLSELDEFDGFYFLLNLKQLLKYRTKRSTLEILLLLHHCLYNVTSECQCFLDELFHPYNIKYLGKYLTLIKNILQFISTKVSANLVEDNNSHWKSDYQLHLLHLLKVSFEIIYERIEFHSHPQDEYDRMMEVGLLTMVDQITKITEILISRHGWHYRKTWQRCIKTSRAGPTVKLPIRHQFFNYYEHNAGIGRFPHIFWQDTPLSCKISHYDSLDVIFAKGNEETCCICTSAKEIFQDNFAIFLDCNHIVCAPCAERLLIGTQTRRCPMCRTNIQSWTTKNIVQLTLDEQKQQVEVIADEQRQQVEVIANEQRQQVEVIADEQRQKDKTSQIPNKEVGGISVELFYEVGRFDSSEKFLNCLQCLDAVKSELSLIEILQILLTNLSIGMCTNNRGRCIDFSKFEAPCIISGLQIVESIIGYVLREGQNGRLKMPSEGHSDIVERFLFCFVEIQMLIYGIRVLCDTACPSNKEEINRQEKVLYKLLDETEHFFLCTAKTSLNRKVPCIHKFLSCNPFSSLPRTASSSLHMTSSTLPVTSSVPSL